MSPPPFDRTITLDEPYEVDYWTTELNVGDEDLRLAVAQVGPSEAAVRLFLNCP